MKRILFLIGAIALLSSVNSVNAQLLWADEFNGTSVNTGVWTFETGAGGWGNNELQYYRSQNATVSGGILTITAKRENYGGAAYTSARIKTQSKYTKQYGFMQARLKCPMGQGLWPAFWMLGQNIGSVGWPSCGEIDIMEHVNTENRVLGTIHWSGPSGYASYGGNKTTTPASWHDYQINWNQYSIKWYVDGVQYHVANIEGSINSTEEFHRPFFFLLNFAVGGNWPGSPNSSTPFPSYYQIDYVRVYQQASAKSANGAEAEPVFNADGTFREFVLVADDEVEAPMAPAANETEIYPNPLSAGSSINVNLANYNADVPVYVTIIDMKGAILYKNVEQSGQFTVETNNLFSTGMYSIKLENGSNITVKKLLIQ